MLAISEHIPQDSLVDRYTIKYSTCKDCPLFNQCVYKGKRTAHHGRSIDPYLTDEAFLITN